MMSSGLLWISVVRKTVGMVEYIGLGFAHPAFSEAEAELALIRIDLRLAADVPVGDVFGVVDFFGPDCFARDILEHAQERLHVFVDDKGIVATEELLHSPN